MRVTHYQSTFRNVKTGKYETEQRPFTQVQLNDIGAVLGANGISFDVAQRLVRKWNGLTALGNFYKVVDA